MPHPSYHFNDCEIINLTRWKDSENGSLSQQAEEIDLKSIKSGFESQRSHHFKNKIKNILTNLIKAVKILEKWEDGVMAATKHSKCFALRA